MARHHPHLQVNSSSVLPRSSLVQASILLVRILGPAYLQAFYLVASFHWPHPDPPSTFGTPPPRSYLLRDVVVEVALCAVHIWDSDGLQLLLQKAQPLLLHCSTETLRSHARGQGTLPGPRLPSRALPSSRAAEVTRILQPGSSAWAPVRSARKRAWSRAMATKPGGRVRSGRRCHLGGSKPHSLDVQLEQGAGPDRYFP